jgi:hypothetical protein
MKAQGLCRLFQGDLELSGDRACLVALGDAHLLEAARAWDVDVGWLRPGRIEAGNSAGSRGLVNMGGIDHV